MADKTDTPKGASEETPKPTTPRTEKSAAAGSHPAGEAGDSGPRFAPTPGVEWIAGLREITTTSIAGLVVLAAMLMLLWTFVEADGAEAKKDIMLYGLSILGSIIGFYFGRVPAERRAEAAEANRNQAQETARHAQATATTAQNQAADHGRAKDEAQKKLAMAKTGIEKARTELRPAATRTAADKEKLLGGGESAATMPSAMDAYLELEALSRLL